MPRFLEPYENLGLSLIFEVMSETRFNRSSGEYMAIAARLPHLKELHFQVNVLWKKYKKACPRELVLFAIFDKATSKRATAIIRMSFRLKQFVLRWSCRACERLFHVDVARLNTLCRLIF